MNIFKLDISQGLRDHEVGAGEYFLLIDAPPLANVTVKPNSQFGATGIPLKSGHDVRSRKEVNKWFISSDAVVGGVITILMSDSDEPLTINTVPSDVNVSEIGSLSAFGAAALAQLDKAANPYDITPTYSINSTASVQTTVLTKVLTCDTIDLNISTGVAQAGAWGVIYVRLDGVDMLVQNHNNHGTYGGEYSSYYDNATLYGVKGKTLSIIMGNSVGYQCTAFITEKTLKA